MLRHLSQFYGGEAFADGARLAEALRSFKEPFIKMEDRRWFYLYPRKFRVDWIEEEIMFPRNHKRRDLQDSTRSGIEPPVTQLFGTKVFERRVFAEILFVNDADSLRQQSGHTNVAAREVVSGHVHQILEDCQRDALGHVDDGSPGRIPAAADELGSCAIETRVTRPAYAENALAA
jgi:hypothetical protein